MAVGPVLPDDVGLRRVHEPGDFGRIAAMGSEVWGTISAGWRGLPNEGAGSADEIVVLVAESGERVISAAWLVFTSGTEFACLWGGSTVRAWRSRGIYRALIARRAHLACARGVRYLERGRLRRQQAHPAQAWLPGGHDHDSRRPDPQLLGMHGEARALLREAFPLSGDRRITDSPLHVRLDPVSAHRRSTALAALCAELTVVFS